MVLGVLGITYGVWNANAMQCSDHSLSLGREEYCNVIY
jgi:hypothetical protein